MTGFAPGYKIVLTAKGPLNMIAFGDSLKKFPGVLSCELKGNSGIDGYGLWYANDSTGAHLRFRAAWGDCLAGCMSSKEWLYSVSLKDCRVVKDTIKLNVDNYRELFLTNCGVYPLAVASQNTITTGISLFPNPASGLLHLKGAGSLPISYKIIDATGRVLLEGFCVDNTIRVSSLPAGFYTIMLHGPAGIVNVRNFIQQ